tara:strand:+ start:305 stop:880 length:576 start_codon:yes stop_codon:yes gene_type:complete
MNIDTKYLKNIIEDHIDLAKEMLNQMDTILSICSQASAAIKRGNKIIFCGNGGSASDSSHLAAELVGRFEKDRDGIPAISLTENSSNITAIANDYGFDKVYSRQLESLGHKGDILIAISTSGNSPNVIEAIKKANELEIKCFGLTGNDGGLMTSSNCKELLIINSNSTARIQELHILFGHILCQYIENQYI